MNAVIYWLHLIGIVFWVGGVFVNMLVLMPSLQVLNPPDRGKMMGVYFKRFVPLSWGAVALVGVTGLLLTNRVLGFSALVSFDTSYGNILLAKIILAAAMIINGAYQGVVLGPKIASFAPAAAAVSSTSATKPKMICAGRLCRSSLRGLRPSVLALANQSMGTREDRVIRRPCQQAGSACRKLIGGRSLHSSASQRGEMLTGRLFSAQSDVRERGCASRSVRWFSCRWTAAHRAGNTSTRDAPGNASSNGSFPPRASSASF